MKHKKTARRHKANHRESSKVQKTRKKGVSDRAGNYDLDGISQDDNFDVVVASEKDPHARHPNPSLATYFRNIKNKVTELFKN